jgi:ribosomal protein S18 acetylase RimI-like enzyme
MVCTTFPRCAPPLPSRIDELAARGLSLRDAGEADAPFLQALHASFRADEMAFLPWPQAQKDAFLADQFRLQHLHYVSHFSNADFCIVERANRTDVKSAVGRFYLDRSAPLWRAIDLGFVPEARGQGLGSALLTWAQVCARDANAAGIDLHVTVVNVRARSLYQRLGFRPEGVADGYHQRMVWRPG